MPARPRRASFVIGDEIVKADAPGHKAMRRAGGPLDHYWIAPPAAVRRGYRPKSLRLSSPTTLEDVEALAARCRDANRQVLDWLERPDDREALIEYDGTVRSLIAVYVTHPDSPFQEIAGTSRQTYEGQLRVVDDSVGARRLDRLQPIDVKRWYKTWRSPAEPGGEERVRRAYAGIQMLRICFSFGASLGIHDSKRLLSGLGDMRFEQPTPRSRTMTAQHVDRFVDVALSREEVRIAIGAACQFEFTLRQSDVIGQWIACKTAEIRPTDLIFGARVWRGLAFEMIDDSGVLRITSGKSGVATAYDLAAYPIVQRCLARLEPSARRGPFVVREDGLPIDRWEYARRWREIATAADIPADVWNRDMRASGVTEAREAGASIEDVSKAAGHRSVATTSGIYDRSGVEVTSRVQHKRIEARKKK